MTVLLAIIYVSFISLGLPDSLLGAVWPTMRADLAAPLPMAGMVSMISAGCTIISSLFSSRMVSRFGTGKVTLVSTAMTAVALVGYALAPSAWMLVLAAIPLGLGAGGVDAGLNNYVALHYEAKHMSWLHCFWGLGAMGGSLILSACIGLGAGWRSGYGVVIAIQTALVIVLACTQKLWRSPTGGNAAEEASQPLLTNAQVLRLPGMKSVLITFFCYCASEACMMLWIASFAEQVHLVSKDQAALLSSLFYAGITAGRALSGFLTLRFSSKVLIRTGSLMMLAGAVLLLLPAGYAGLIAGTALIGLGCAPVYPCTIHETPNRFGVHASQSATGLQMACAYTGSTFMPPLLGLISGALGLKVFPVILTGFIVAMLLSGEAVNRIHQK